MALPKRTSRNQLNLPKAVVDQVSSSESYDVVYEDGRIALTHDHPGVATLVRSAGRNGARRHRRG